MPEQVAVFMDYENIRRGLLRHFHKDIPKDITVEKLLDTIKQIANEIGSFYEAYIYGDWTIRPEDAKAIEKTPQFRCNLVLRADSKKDRTDPVMNFAIDDFYRDKNDINNIILCAGDSDYCEVVRRGNRIHKNIYICAVSPQTAPEILSLAKTFYPIEQRLGLEMIDMAELALAVASLNPDEVKKWAPLIKQLEMAERRLPNVVRSHFIKRYLASGLEYGDTFEQKAMTLDFAVGLGILEDDKIPFTKEGRIVRTVKLNRNNNMVKAILADIPPK